MDKLAKAALNTISPIKPADSATLAAPDTLFTAKRTEAGRALPEYYLVFFLLVDFLGFKNMGQFEKVAWSVPIDFRGKAFLIEHRKFGVGVFAQDIPEDEPAAAEIVALIRRGVKIAQPYFDFRAKEAAKDSKLNVVNKSRELLDRFRFFSDRYDALDREAQQRANERIRSDISDTSFTITMPSFELRKHAKWMALAAIDSFFSWTEHIFILLAIIQQHSHTGESVAALARENWATKFKAALDITDPKTKEFYDLLLLMREQLRNFVAHGAFGKDGEAFSFHSGCGAVPMRLPHQSDPASFKFGHGIEFVDREALALLDRFEAHIWEGRRSPAKLYIQEHGMPLILTMARSGGDYERAMSSIEEMEAFSDHLSELMDRNMNMDF